MLNRPTKDVTSISSGVDRVHMYRGIFTRDIYYKVLLLTLSKCEQLVFLTVVYKYQSFAVNKMNLIV